jgi:hypothetical protein
MLFTGPIEFMDASIAGHATLKARPLATAPVIPLKNSTVKMR